MKNEQALFSLFSESKCPIYFFDNQQMLNAARWLSSRGVVVINIQNKWISTNDAVPKLYEQVEGLKSNGDVDKVRLVESDQFGDGLSWRDQNGLLLGMGGITHWRPLP